MLEVEQCGIYRVRLPLPYRLNHVNCYAIKGSKGWWLVDSGLNDEPTRRGWKRFMEDHKVMGNDIKGIYLTHYHPDHFGASAWLQQISGAPVYISSLEAVAVDKYWGQGEQNFTAVTAMFVENGMPGDLAGAMEEYMLQQLPLVRPIPFAHHITAGEEVRLGDYTYRVLLTPGHTDGHVCFYNEKENILFSGDFLLPKISSNISLWPYLYPNPLKKFLNSLRDNHWLKNCLVLPAHGECFKNAKERIIQLEEHHQERLKLIKDVASRGVTAYEVCRHVFSGNLSLHEMRFAMAETLSHLVFLTDRGELRVLYKNRLTYYIATE